MVEPISSTSGASSAYQTNYAAMQEMLIQKMFHATDANGDGAVSKSEFENFYNQFMGSNSRSGISPSTTAAADQLYEQLNPAGRGMTLSQFAVAVKLMMSQKAQGVRHQADAGAGAAASLLSAAGSVPNNPATWFGKLLASSDQGAGGQTAPAQNVGSLEFIA